MASPKAVKYGLVILGSVLTLHLGSTFIKPLVTSTSSSSTNNNGLNTGRIVESEEDFVNKLKQQL